MVNATLKDSKKRHIRIVNLDEYKNHGRELM